MRKPRFADEAWHSVLGGGSGSREIAIAVALFLAVFVFRWISTDPASAASMLYTIPVVLLALRFKTIGGVIGGLVAFALSVVWGVLRTPDLGAVAVVVRLLVFLVIGSVVGWLAHRLDVGAVERRHLLAIAQNSNYRGDRARLIEEFLGLLSRSATEQQVAEAYVSIGLRIIGASRGGVYALDPTTRTLNLVAIRRPIDVARWQRIPLTAAVPVVEAVRGRTQLFLRDLDQILGTYPHLRGAVDQSGDQAWAAAPLLGAGRILGAMSASFASPQRFDPKEREMFAILARRVADALERANLLGQARQERSRAEASEQRASLLADVGAVMSTASTSAERMQRLADLLVPAYADFVTVEVASGCGIQLLVASHADHASLATLREQRACHGDGEPDRWQVLDCLRSATSRLISEVDLPSIIVVPLRGSSQIIAALVLGRSGTDRRFDQADRAMCELIAGRASLALDNARLYEEQREVAATLQQALLPAAFPQIDGVTASAHYRPREVTMDVGGDWYDVLALPAGRVGIVLGDVVGSGVVAAATMGRLRTAVAALAPYCSGPADLLGRVDDFADAVEGARLATAVYAEFDPGSGVLRYACAGHPPPVLIDGAGRASLLRGGRGVPLATAPDRERTQAEVEIVGSAVLVCYSDGLVERRGVDVDTRLEDLLVAVQDLAGAGLEPLREGILASMVGDLLLDDDVALLCLSLECTATMIFHEVLPADGACLASLRARLRQWGSRTGLAEDQVADLVLATGEACANTIEHAYVDGPGLGEVDVRAEYTRNGTVTVRVSDHGHWRAQSNSGHRGRGIALMRATMESVTIDSGRSGTTVTMRAVAVPSRAELVRADG